MLKSKNSLKSLMIFSFMLVCLFLSTLESIYAAEPVSGTNSDTGYSFYLYDEADFLASASDSEMNALIDELEQITEFSNVAFVTTTDHSYSTTEAFALVTLEQQFGYSDGVIFVIDRDLNQIYLLSEGSAQKKISNRICTTICDNTYVYATQAYNYDYYTCAYKTFSQVISSYQGERIAKPMKYICNALLAISLGMLLCYIIAHSTSKMRKPTKQKILFGIFSNFTAQNSQTTFINQTRVYSPPSSSGGSGGGYSGGGHSGGGGGGHSGGGGGGHSGGGHGI